MVRVDMKLVFDKCDVTYRPGDVVSGRVTVSTLSPVNVKSITVTFRGETRTSWKENKQEHSGHEKYFDNTITLFGDGRQAVPLPPGDYAYPFKLQLCQYLPPSFHHRHGDIVYKVWANMDVPWALDPYVERKLEISPPVDLRSNPSLKEPLRMEKHCKLFSLFCCSSSPVVMTCSVPVQGYVPGEHITLHVDIDNTSNQVIGKVLCEIIQRVIFYSTKRETSRDTEQVIAEAVLDGIVPPHSSREWMERILVPPVDVPTFVKICRLIDCTYLLKIIAKPNGAHFSIKQELPIVIGTIPLDQF